MEESTACLRPLRLLFVVFVSFAFVARCCACDVSISFFHDNLFFRLHLDFVYENFWVIIQATK
jgi:hypothetical protein